MMYERFQTDKVLPLLELLELTQDSGAMDPRDRVFALLGLVEVEEKLRIKLDYSLSPCEAFCSAVRAMAKDTNRSREVMRVLNEWADVP